MSYNINGLANKTLYKDVFDYICSFDVFILLETHVETENFEKYFKFFKGFTLFWRSAVRRSHYGRASGGLLYGIKKDLENVDVRYSFKCLDCLDVIEFCVAEKTVNLIPLYLKGNNWIHDFEIVKESFVQNDFVNGVVIGDLNVRIGDLQVNMDEILLNDIVGGKADRNSRDKKINRGGRKFIEFCINNGLIVLNGMLSSDVEGKFTYVSNIGESVNDICAISRDILKHASDFIVDNKTWSDHMPIILKMQLPARKSASICKTNLLPKMVWDELRAELYNKKLISNLQKKKYVKKELDLEDLTEIIRISTSQRRNKERLRKKSEWFTWKCQSARKMSLKQLRIYNKTLSGSDKKKYIQANRKYKKLCEESKKSYYDNLELRINEVNNSKDWWKMVNVLRCSVTESCLEVSPAIFMHYFQTLLNPTRCAPCIQYVANLVRDDCLDRPISIDEIRLMLQKTKCGKAPGSDKVPYEFFKNADDRFLVELANVFNRLYNMGQVSECFETSLIFPLFKKGDRKSPSNYRGISFMNCVAKIMMGILNERLTSWVENKNIITEFQAGFRKRHSTVDNIYNLAAIVHIKFREKKKVYAFFVDFKAAFDTV